MRYILPASLLALGLAACASTGPSIDGVGFQTYDADADGRVTRTEFTGETSTFESIDKNNDDVLTTAEVADFNAARSRARAQGRNQSMGSRL